LFAQRDYKAAAAAVLVGLHYMPEFPGLTIDLRSLHHDPAEYEAMMDDLEAKARDARDDDGMDAVIPLPENGVDLPLAEIYRGMNFPPDVDESDEKETNE
jgi:hypothetical protein